MRGGIMTGVFDLESAMKYSCSTGNCTWPAFTNLGVCSHCTNVTLQSNPKCEVEVDLAGPISNDTRTSCSYTLPEDVYLSTYANVYKSPTGPELNLTAITSLTTIGRYSYRTPSPFAAIANFSTIILPDFAKGDARFDATQCDLFWCAKSYSAASVLNGTLNATPVIDVPLIEHNFSQAGIDGNETPGRITRYLKPQDNKTDLPGDGIFAVNEQAQKSMREFIQFVFNATSIVTTTIVPGDPGLVLAQSGNVTRTVENMVQAMNNQIRICPNGTQLSGTAWRPETFWSVRWIWISLPAAFALLGLLFMILAILKASRRQTKAWKSSSLALLFANLQGWDIKDLRVRKPQDVKTAARRMRGALRSEEEPLMFKKMAG